MIFALGLLLPGCPEVPDPQPTPAVVYELDDSGVPDGRVLSYYHGLLKVRGLDGAATWELVGGSLPLGLSLDDNGTISGLPLLPGSWAFDVRSEQVSGTVDIAVEPGVDEVRVGLRTQLNNLDAVGNLMNHHWVRVSGGGRPDLQTITLDAGLYAPGTDRQHAGGDAIDADGALVAGFSDDIRLYSLPPDELVVELIIWHPSDEVEPSEGHPSPHENEGSPPTIEPGGVVRGGADSGEGVLRVSWQDVPPVEARLTVVAPDWCPMGEHRGGPWYPGQCE